MACRFDSPSLVTSVSGISVTPTFAFDSTNTDFFGLKGSFTSSNGAVCSFPARSAVTPVIITSSGFFGRNTYCSTLQPPSANPTGGDSTAYNGIECPAITNSAFLPGTYTLAFWQDYGVPSISSQVFLIASATTSTDIATKTYYETTIFPAETTSTTSITKFTSTATWTASRSLSTTTTTVPTTVTSNLTSCSSSSRTSSSIPSSTPTSLPTSKDGSCGASSGQTCLGSSFGACCSKYGYCGSTDSYCSTGCQPLFGTCDKPSAPQPSPTLKISLNGSCGKDSAQTCRGSSFGDCCSQYGFCGQTSAYCSEGCQVTYGDCDDAQKKPAALLRAKSVHNKKLVGRDIGGKGPDYTYPPIPHTTVTTSVTHVIIVFPSAVVSTSTVLGATTTTVGGVITFTQTVPAATRTATVCPRV